MHDKGENTMHNTMKTAEIILHVILYNVKMNTVYSSIAPRGAAAALRKSKIKWKK